MPLPFKGKPVVALPRRHTSHSYGVLIWTDSQNGGRMIVAAAIIVS
jgi:hypothetical protein